MSKTGKIVGGIAVFFVSALILGLLRELHLGALPYMGVVLLSLYVFSRVTGLNMGFGGTGKTTNENTTPKDTNMPRYCPKCGKGYDATWKVCLSCSSQLADNTTKGKI